MKIIGEFNKITFAVVIVLLSSLSVILSVLKDQEEDRRIGVEAKLNNVIAYNTKVSNKLAAKEKEFADFIQNSKDTESMFSNLSNKIKSLEGELASVANEKQELAAKIKSQEERESRVSLDKIVIKPLPGHEGKIIKVNSNYSFVVVSLGAKKDVSVGDILSVYRSGNFIGRLVVEKVQDEYCAASILPAWRDAQIKEDDTVKEL